MKILFIEAQNKNFPEIGDNELKKLPERIFLAYSAQYKKLAEKLKKRLGKSGRKVAGIKQVLGCTKIKSKVPILLIGSGRFHALNLALQGNTVYVSEGNNIKKLESNEIEKIKSRKKVALLKFYSSGKIGILVSIKPGQESLDTAVVLREKLEKKGKKARIFITDNINTNELENYSIPVWINTACPGIILDDLSSSKILNIDDLEL